MKQQQIAEMNQLKAVQHQLGAMRENSHLPVLNSSVTNNLNSYINNQKEQILKMSQSSQNMSQIVRHANQMMNLAGRQSTTSPVNQSQQNESQFQFQVNQSQSQPNDSQIQFQEHSQMIPITREQQEQELPVLSEKVDIGQDPRQINFQAPEEYENYDLQQQVDELAKQIAANENEIAQGHKPLDLEQSLGGHSKMVKVPNKNLTEVASQIQEVTETGDLTETWNEEAANSNLQKAGVLSPPRGLAKIMSNSATPVPQSRFGNLGSVPRSPMGSSQVPHTIPELPHEEEKGVNQAVKHKQNASGFNFQSECENDMNDRQSNIGDDLFHQQRPSDEVEANLEKIERLVNKTQSGFTDRKATITGSSFYERTMQAQKVQEQNQQEEMQKQLARILGGTSVSESQNNETDSPNVLAALQEQYGPGVQANQGGVSHHSSVKIRASQELLHKPAYAIPEDSKESTRPQELQNLTIENTSEINIANTQTSIALQQVQLDKFNNPSRMHEIQDQSAIKPIDTSRQEEEKQQLESEAQMLQIQDRQSQIIESRKTFQPELGSQSVSRVSNQVPSAQIEQTNEPSVWDDPDMVSVPVLPAFTDNSISYDAHENTNQSNVLKEEPYVSPIPDESQQRNRNNASSIMNTDGTIAGLQRLVPDIIKTEEFELNQVSNPTSGEQQIDIKPIGNRRIWQQPMDESQPDFDHHQTPQHVTIDQSPRKNHQSKSPERSPQAELEKTVTTQLSKKEKEMQEIEALIRKATNTVNIANERESERKKSLLIKKNNPGEQEVSQTPRDNPQQNFLPDAPSQFVQQHLQTADPSNGDNSLEKMQLAGNPSQPSLSDQKLGMSNSNNDKQILADLDKIISNLEKQQKNMQTFGIPKLTEADDEEEDGELDKEPRPVTATPEGMRPPDMMAESEQVKPKTSQTVSVSEAPVQSESRWTSLQAARDAQKISPRPPTSKSGKAPLPISRPKSGLENKSKITNTSRCDASPQRLGKYAQMALQGNDLANESKSKITNTSRCDASPQRVGKYAQMAIQGNNDPANESKSKITNTSRCDASPQRVGKYAQMAIQSNNDPANTSKISARVSPQHVGKYAQMAMQSNNQGGLRQPSPLQKRLNLSRSPQSVGKYAQMAMQNNAPQQEMKSPQKMGKFAQMAIQNNVTPDEQVLDNISQKYGRNPSRDRLDRSNISGDGKAGMNTSYYTNNQQNDSLPNKILRPVSGKSTSSRYGGKSPGAMPHLMGQVPNTGQTLQRPQTDLAHETIQDPQVRAGSTMTPGTQRAVGTGTGRIGNNVAYCSDEEEEQEKMHRQTRNAFAPPYHQTLNSQASGMTEMTQQNKQVRSNIKEL